MLPVPIQLDKNKSEAMYLQIANQVATMIQHQQLEGGRSLPSIRKLATLLEVNNVTIVSAYKHLETLGLVIAKKGSGYYVKEKQIIPPSIPSPKLSMQQITSQHLHLEHNQINFASATPEPSIFPIASFKHYLNYVLDRDQGYAFGYQESNGYEPLRESLCQYLKRRQKLEVSPNSIQIVSGAQQGIDIIGKTLLGSGDCVFVEDPTYTGALAVFKSRDVLIKGISLEEDGLNLSELEAALLTVRPKLLYVMTKYQNPSTVTYSLKKMKRLIELAQLYDFYIVEDDSMSELNYEPDASNISFKSLDQNERVIYIKSFSKIMMPGLRIGFILVPSPLSTDIMNAKHHTDISSSGLIQRTVDLYLREGQWDEHINQMRIIYKKKYDIMVQELNKLKAYDVKFHIPHGGLHFWIQLPPHLNANELYDLCLSHSLITTPGKLFSPTEDTHLNQYMRLSFAACTEADIIKGIDILKQCLHLMNNKKKQSTYISPLI